MTSKTVLITGAARRIGASISRELHQRGWDIVIHYHHSEQAATTLAGELNSARADSAMTLQANLLENQSYALIVEQSYRWKKQLHALVNNASAFYSHGMGEVSVQQWDELIGTNMKAPFFLSQQAAQHLRENQGCIINLTDIHAQRPLKNYPVYSAAKAGLVMLTKALAKELGPKVRVNAVSPGAILWPEDMDETTQQEMINRIVLKRCGEPLDIAKAVRYLLEDAGYVTGQILAVDGGRTLSS